MESLIDVVRRAQKEQQDDLELLRVLKAQLANLQLEMSTLINENTPKEPSVKQEARNQPPCAAPPKVTPSHSTDSSSSGLLFLLNGLSFLPVMDMAHDDVLPGPLPTTAQGGSLRLARGGP